MWRTALITASVMLTLLSGAAGLLLLTAAGTRVTLLNGQVEPAAASWLISGLLGGLGVYCAVLTACLGGVSARAWQAVDIRTHRLWPVLVRLTTPTRRIRGRAALMSAVPHLLELLQAQAERAERSAA